MPLPAIGALIARAAAAVSRFAGQAVANAGRGFAAAAAEARTGIAMGTRSLGGATAAGGGGGLPPIIANFFGAQQSPAATFAQAAQAAQAAPAGGHYVPPLPPSPNLPPPAPWMPSLSGMNPSQLLQSGPTLTSLVQNIRTGDRTIDGFKDLAVAMLTLPAQVRDFGASVVEARRQLVEYNGTIANAMTRLEHDRFGRNIRLAAATSASTEGLVESQSRLEEKLMPYMAAGVNALNRLVQGTEVAVTTAVTMLEMIKPLETAAIKWLGGVDKKDPPEAGLAELARNIAQGKLFERSMPPSGKPPRRGSRK